MIALKRVLAPVDDTPFNDICSFESENYVGIWTDTDGFVILTKNDNEFIFRVIGFPDSLEELDEMLYKYCEEHIDFVSTSRHISVNIIDD